MMICNRIREYHSTNPLISREIIIIGEAVGAFQKSAITNHSQYSTASLIGRVRIRVDEEVLLKMTYHFNTAKQKSPITCVPN